MRLLIFTLMLALCSSVYADVTITLKIGPTETTRTLSDLELKRVQLYYVFLNYKEYQADPENFTPKTAIQRFKLEVNEILNLAIKHGTRLETTLLDAGDTAAQEARADAKKAEIEALYPSE